MISISEIIINWNWIKNIRFEFYECFWIKIALRLISIFGCDNKWSTISVWPSNAARNNAVKLNDFLLKFQKWLEIEIESKILYLNSINVLELK